MIANLTLFAEGMRNIVFSTILYKKASVNNPSDFVCPKHAQLFSNISFVLNIIVPAILCEVLVRVFSFINYLKEDETTIVNSSEKLIDE